MSDKTHTYNSSYQSRAAAQSRGIVEGHLQHQDGHRQSLQKEESRHQSTDHTLNGGLTEEGFLCLWGLYLDPLSYRQLS